ncbi:DUF6328 family protein [Nocardioides panaciterrulae]|uniref:SNF family Na+-dependent transporter n=1 Tax=Nocardioides panaciterrulae TaxID=661492 RepID=A0A7Y9E4H2_9ACTN|nr:SNF family Na+-dependent transporter [Nocardioides panaciterrulae]
MTQDDDSPEARSGRNETEEERLDRKWDDLLQELRVMQTSAQLTAGFLLTLPFQSGFAKLDDFQRGLYLALVLLAALTTAMVMTPVAVHRRLSGAHIKERVVDSGHRIVQAVIGMLSLMILGIVTLVFDVVIDRTISVLVAACVGVILLLLLVVLPRRLMRAYS